MLHSRLRPLPRRHRPDQRQGPISQESSSISDDRNEDDYGDEEEDAEDLFSSFLPHLLPDDAAPFHGDPGQRLLYESPLYGPLEIMVPSYPGQNENRTEEIAAGQKSDGSNSVEEGRKLFAHFLWSAAMVVAEGVEDVAAAEAGKKPIDLEKTMWSVRGKRVLELGAGAGLPSIISVLSSASRVTITDHPYSPAFVGALDYNIATNVPASVRPTITAEPHEWGILTDRFAMNNKGGFSRIVAADCLWMRDEHENLVKTMLWFLAPEDGRIWVVAGFHTGRGTVASFFETALRGGLEIEKIFERDLNAAGTDGQGEHRREWMAVREGEGPENRTRWCVIAVLRRASMP